MSAIEQRRLECGMDLLVESMPAVRSVGVSWLITGGSASEPQEKQGLGAMMTEMLFRGAGPRDAREHADAMDRLGVSRSASVQTFFMNISGVTLGLRVIEALELFTDMLRNPIVDQADVEPVRDLCIQSIEALADDPHGRVMLLARKMHAPSPINRSSMGTIETLKAITRNDLAHYWRQAAAPIGSAIALAGDVDPDEAESTLNRLLDGWTGQSAPVTWGASDHRGYHHETDDTNQVHIAVVHEAPCESSKDSILERVITSVLSGGMSGRLFTEVREKRALVYSVSASYGASRDFGRVVAYAGTTPDKAQETLDVLLDQLRALAGDSGAGAVSQDEFDRAIVGMKSNLVMSGESTSARAAALGADWFRLGRPRSLEERAAAVEAVTLDDVNGYIARRSLGEITVATIGPRELCSSL